MDRKANGMVWIIISLIMGIFLLIIFGVPTILKASEGADKTLDTSKFFTCDYDGTEGKGLTDQCPCNSLNPRFGRGYVLLEEDFQWPDDEGDPVYKLFDKDKIDELENGRFLTEHDAKEMVKFVAGKNLDGSSYDEPIDFSTRARPYLTEAVIKDDYSQISSASFCIGLKASTWEECAPEDVNTIWFQEIEAKQNIFGEEEKGLTYKTECFTSDAECLELIEENPERC